MAVHSSAAVGAYCLSSMFHSRPPGRLTVSTNSRSAASILAARSSIAIGLAAVGGVGVFEDVHADDQLDDVVGVQPRAAGPGVRQDPAPGAKVEGVRAGRLGRRVGAVSGVIRDQGQERVGIILEQLGELVGSVLASPHGLALPLDAAALQLVAELL